MSYTARKTDNRMINVDPKDHERRMSQSLET